MRCGLFGKLWAKRDFVAVATPRPFLEVWEPWVQACISASQDRLGANWQSAYLTAPLWRFWLGANLSGTTVAGVVMPSVDGVGRCYPLTLFSMAEPSIAIPPPDVSSQDGWFAMAEDFLLATLDRDRSFEEITVALDAFPSPRAEPDGNDISDVIFLSDSITATAVAGSSFQDALAALRTKNHSTSAAACFWWTEGGEGFPPMALASHGLLDPYCYTILLTGQLPA